MVGHPRLTSLETDVALAARAREERLRDAMPHRRKFGIVHTPPEVARYMAVAVDGLLTQKLGMSAGLADAGVSIVDPACGTGVFGAACLAVAGERDSAPAAFVSVDVDPAATAVAADTLFEAFQSRGWPLRHEVGNALSWDDFPVDASRSPARVVIGNPPWAGRSASRGLSLSDTWLEDFRCDGDGRRLDERRLGVLSDDYVRFWRWSAQLVRQAAGGGVVALVTNDSFLQGPVHRGMRGALCRWFHGLQIVVLGGGSLAERAPGRDDNLFGVRPGAAIMLAWRSAGDTKQTAAAEVRYARLRGAQDDKLKVCLGGAIPLADRFQPQAPFYIFAPQVDVPPGYWDRWLSLVDLWPFHQEGVQTNRDAALVDEDPARLRSRVGAFLRGKRTADDASLWLPKRHFDPDAVRARLASTLSPDDLPVRRLAYRPFDTRYFFPLAPLCHRPRPKLLQAVDASQWVLLSVRKDRGEGLWGHASVTTDVPDNSYFSSRSACRTRAFPSHGIAGRPNVSEEGIKRISKSMGIKVRASEVQLYALCVLSSPAYARAAASALRVDYPRLPPPTAALWPRLVRHGDELRRALLRPARDDTPLAMGHRALTRSPPGLVSARSEADRAVAELLLTC